MWIDTVLDRIGKSLAVILEKESSGYRPFTLSDPVTLQRCLRPGDILLVESNQKISAAIKYLTQSTWSHAAIFIGDALGSVLEGDEPLTLIESNLGEGTVAVPLSKYATYNTRICRPVGLTQADRRDVVQFMVAHLGTKYDTRHIFDFARYLFPTPPMPVRWRRRMLALGSGDPTRVICSTLIAQAFQRVRYPILPYVEKAERQDTAYSRAEILHIRHHSLFAPRDFDLSPYFDVVKPTIEGGFDYKALVWGNKVIGADGRTVGDGGENEDVPDQET